VSEAIDAVGDVNSARLGAVQTTGNQATATVSVTGDGGSANYTGTLSNQNGKWCWQDIRSGSSASSRSSSPSSRGAGSSSSTPNSSGGSGSSETYNVVAQDFLSKVNSGDSAGAMALVCSQYVSDIQPNVSDATSKGAQLSADMSGVDGIGMGDLKGSIGGQAISGGFISTDEINGGPQACIDNFDYY
jgi:hypothetical protein